MSNYKTPNLVLPFDDSLSNMSTRVPIDAAYDSQKPVSRLTLPSYTSEEENVADSAENTGTSLNNSQVPECDNSTAKNNSSVENNSTNFSCQLNESKKPCEKQTSYSCDEDKKFYRRRPVALASVDKETCNLSFYKESLELLQNGFQDTFAVVGVVGCQNQAKYINELFFLPSQGFFEDSKRKETNHMLWLWGQPIRLCCDNITKYIMLVYFDDTVLAKTEPKKILFKFLLSIISFMIVLAPYYDTSFTAESFVELARGTDNRYRNDCKMVWIATDTYNVFDTATTVLSILKDKHVLEITCASTGAKLFSECKASVLPMPSNTSYQDAVSKLSQKLFDMIITSITRFDIPTLSVDDLMERINYTKHSLHEFKCEKEPATSLNFDETEKTISLLNEASEQEKCSQNSETILEKALSKLDDVDSSKECKSVSSRLGDLPTQYVELKPKDNSQVRSRMASVIRRCEVEPLYAEYLQHVSESIKNAMDFIFDKDNETQNKSENFRKALTEAVPKNSKFSLTHAYLKKIIFLISSPLEQFFEDMNQLAFENIQLNQEIKKLYDVNDLKATTENSTTETNLTSSLNEEAKQVQGKSMDTNEKVSAMDKIMSFCLVSKQTKLLNMNEKLNLTIDELKFRKNEVENHKDQVIKLSHELEKTENQYKLLQERYNLQHQKFNSYRNSAETEIFNLTNELIEAQKTLALLKAELKNCI